MDTSLALQYFHEKTLNGGLKIATEEVCSLQMLNEVIYEDTCQMQSHSMFCAHFHQNKIVFVLEFTQIIENLDQKVCISVQLPLEQFWVMPS